MCGGFSVLKDVYKTTVYALSDWRNKNDNNTLVDGTVIPSGSLQKLQLRTKANHINKMLRMMNWMTYSVLN